MLNSRKVGVLGGTFDPIHYGHLRIAETLRESYALDTVYLIPVGLPPHRALPQASGQHRLQMLQLAISSNPSFAADAREIECKKYSYTIDTLVALKAAHPQAQLVWLVGADAFARMMQWYRWDALLDIAHLSIVHRPGMPPQTWYNDLPLQLKQQYAQRLVTQNTMPYQVLTGKVSPLPTIPFDISATLLRHKIAQKESVRFLTPDAVIDYIDQHGLYQ